MKSCYSIKLIISFPRSNSLMIHHDRSYNSSVRCQLLWRNPEREIQILNHQQNSHVIATDVQQSFVIPSQSNKVKPASINVSVLREKFQKFIYHFPHKNLLFPPSKLIDLLCCVLLLFIRSSCQLMFWFHRFFL